MKKVSVLLVEDNVIQMIVLGCMMKEFDVDISQAIDAESALKLVKSKPFDLVLVNLGLPTMQGDELTTVIRAYEVDNNVKPATIVGITARNACDLRSTCLSSGMEDLFQKPIEPRRLQLLMDKVMKMQAEPSLLQSSATKVPDSESDLLNMEQFPLLDIRVGMDVLGSPESVVMDILRPILTIAPKDLAQLIVAYDNHDVKMVDYFACQLLGGSYYGTVRMQYAVLYFARYFDSGKTDFLEALYFQMTRVVDETLSYLDDYFKKLT